MDLARKKQSSAAVGDGLNCLLSGKRRRNAGSQPACSAQLILRRVRGREFPPQLPFGLRFRFSRMSPIHVFHWPLWSAVNVSEGSIGNIDKSIATVRFGGGRRWLTLLVWA